MSVEEALLELGDRFAPQMTRTSRCLFIKFMIMSNGRINASQQEKCAETNCLIRGVASLRVKICKCTLTARSTGVRGTSVLFGFSLGACRSVLHCILEEIKQSKMLQF